MKVVLFALSFLALAAFAALAIWIRVAPSDPSIWHVPIADATPAIPGPCAEKVTEISRGARATCLPAGDAAAILTRLNATALATPRTTLLAGSPDAGRITWITRSRLMAFPDYITAEVTQTPQGARLDILSRQRFGEKDIGVNALRLRSWLRTF